MSDFEPPIQNFGAVDIVGERKDGGVDLVIVASGPLDGSSDTLSRLGRKVRSYIAEVASQAFREKYPSALPGKVRIIVSCAHAVDATARGLLEVLKHDAEANGATLELHNSVV